ncbi:hypothetical protein FOA52_004933 [Chlamydomonas sp. UWO 241]|nr:hypothetical protein FOA52_004933 [Chlamydomonas sp. UWO 241]
MAPCMHGGWGRVEICQQENANLKAELQELKAGPRLDTLEQSLQELADLSKTDNGYGSMAAPAVSDGASDAAAQEAAAAGAAAAASYNGALVLELGALEDRLTQMERKSEALWHARQSDEELRCLVERLRVDVGAAQAGAAQAAAVQAQVAGTLQRMEAASTSAEVLVAGLQERLGGLEAQVAHSDEAHRDANVMFEHNVGFIAEQVRAVEEGVARQLDVASAGTSAALAEASEARAEARRVRADHAASAEHAATLDARVEALAASTSASLGPVRVALVEAKGRLEDLGSTKLDAADALTMGDVHAAVARAVAHADGRVDNAMLSVGFLEERMEELSDMKGDKDECVLTVDLEALLTAHAAELDRHLDLLKGEILRSVETKAEREELSAVDGRLGARMCSLEAAILKGLKAVSDKVSTALAAKADAAGFEAFRAAVLGELGDIERRLKGWTTAASGQKDSGGGSGATCLSCDARVRNARDLQGAGYPRDDRVFSPERLPAADGLLPAILKSPDIAAHQNARHAQRRRETTNLFTRSTNSLPESMPGHSGHSQPMAVPMAMATADAGSSGGGGGRPNNTGMRVDVETVTAGNGTAGKARGPPTGEGVGGALQVELEDEESHDAASDAPMNVAEGFNSKYLQLLATGRLASKKKAAEAQKAEASAPTSRSSSGTHLPRFDAPPSPSSCLGFNHLDSRSQSPRKRPPSLDRCGSGSASGPPSPHSRSASPSMSPRLAQLASQPRAHYHRVRHTPGPGAYGSPTTTTFASNNQAQGVGFTRSARSEHVYGKVSATPDNVGPLDYAPPSSFTCQSIVPKFGTSVRDVREPTNSPVRNPAPGSYDASAVLRSGGRLLAAGGDSPRAVFGTGPKMESRTFVSEEHARSENAAKHSPGPKYAPELAATHPSPSKYSLLGRPASYFDRVANDTPGPIYNTDPHRASSHRFGRAKRDLEVEKSPTGVPFISNEHAKHSNHNLASPGPALYTPTMGVRLVHGPVLASGQADRFYDATQPGRLA